MIPFVIDPFLPLLMLVGYLLGITAVRQRLSLSILKPPIFQRLYTGTTYPFIQ